MSDRERELERQLRYVLQKSQRYTDAVTEYLDAARMVAEESTQGHSLAGVLGNSCLAAANERNARTLLDYSMKLAWDFLDSKTTDEARVA